MRSTSAAALPGTRSPEVRRQLHTHAPFERFPLRCKNGEYPTYYSKRAPLPVVDRPVKQSIARSRKNDKQRRSDHGNQRLPDVRNLPTLSAAAGASRQHGLRPPAELLLPKGRQENQFPQCGRHGHLLRFSEVALKSHYGSENFHFPA